MQTICLATLIALFIVIIIINVTASKLYLQTEWNFNYTATYEDFIVNLVVANAENSAVRNQCQQEFRCMMLMQRRNISIA